jgi:hypothetical protein
VRAKQQLLQPVSMPMPKPTNSIFLSLLSEHASQLGGLSIADISLNAPPSLPTPPSSPSHAAATQRRNAECISLFRPSRAAPSDDIVHPVTRELLRAHLFHLPSLLPRPANHLQGISAWPSSSTSPLPLFMPSHDAVRNGECFIWYSVLRDYITILNYIPLTVPYYEAGIPCMTYIWYLPKSQTPDHVRVINRPVPVFLSRFSFPPFKTRYASESR